MNANAKHQPNKLTAVARRCTTMQSSDMGKIYIPCLLADGALFRYIPQAMTLDRAERVALEMLEAARCEQPPSRKKANSTLSVIAGGLGLLLLFLAMSFDPVASSKYQQVNQEVSR